MFHATIATQPSFAANMPPRVMRDTSSRCLVAADNITPLRYHHAAENTSCHVAHALSFTPYHAPSRLFINAILPLMLVNIA